MNKQDVIEHFRTTDEWDRKESPHAAVRRIASLIGVTPSAIYKWPDDLDFVKQCMIEVISDGALRANRDAPVNFLSARNRRRREAQRRVAQRLAS